jgi:hypothetical protein
MWRPQVAAGLAALALGVALSAVPTASDKTEAVLQLRGLLD